MLGAIFGFVLLAALAAIFFTEIRRRWDEIDHSVVPWVTGTALGLIALLCIPDHLLASAVNWLGGWLPAWGFMRHDLGVLGLTFAGLAAYYLLLSFVIERVADAVLAWAAKRRSSAAGARAR
ncbi:hypothetical protein [Rhodanobacter thiooxydans]|uniref:hypothetical protein n=1 Tax=Rhodanobacter thiooxydans TaxID=416169 RepID=UPI001F41E490|nr:hypothetical protein [Rhodanobacter thiooxydans]UJJ56696.1 hypothetical protein LRK53_18985 [Rhodanobacter thiooxydans]